MPERHHRGRARTLQKHLDAIGKAISRFRTWWNGGTVFHRKGAGKAIAEELRKSTWPVHWQETEDELKASWKKVEARNARERDQQTDEHGQFRPQLVDTVPRRKRRKDEGGHDW